MCKTCAKACFIFYARKYSTVKTLTNVTSNLSEKKTTLFFYNFTSPQIFFFSNKDVRKKLAPPKNIQSAQRPTY